MPQRAGTIFYGGVNASRQLVKILEEGNWKSTRLDEIVKMGQRKVLYFMQLFLHYSLFGESFIG